MHLNYIEQPSIINKKNQLNNSTLQKPYEDRHSNDFFKSSNFIMSRMNTKKALKLRERAYEQGSMKTNFNFSKALTPEKNSKYQYHIKLKDRIDMEQNKEEQEKYRKVDAKKYNLIHTTGPLSNKGKVVQKCFDSSSVRACLTESSNKYPNERFKSSDFNLSSNNKFKCNYIDHETLKSYSKNYYKKANLNLLSQRMKDSLCSPLDDK